ncbi:MAG TPA: diguanylate cyclase [Candidatus Obscuribacterales bacterium]
MFDWTSQFATQRKDYVVRTLERLQSMDSILAAIAQNPQNLNPVRDLSQHFHQLAGSSAIYELDKLGQVASDAEKVCLTALRNGEIQKPEWKMLKDTIESMRFVCSQHPDMQNDPRHAATVAAAHAAPPAQEMEAVPAANPRAVAREVQRSSGNWASNAVSYVTAAPAYEKPKDIVIVDGDQGSMMTISRALEDSGMHVRGFRTTDGAKKSIQERLPDALILSVPLIDGPGYDVAHHLRQLPDGNVPPILILSRQIGFLDKVMAIRCGADAFFDDVSEPQVIVQKLNSLLERDKASNYTILSVEDDISQSDFIKGILESVGYNVVVVNDPQQFEEAFLSVQPDLLLLDVMLGAVSGFELARYVRADDRFLATPIIFLTTQNQLNAHVESARVGGDEHLIKPVAPPLLIAAVAGRLERYRMLKRLIGRDGLTQFLTLGTFMESANKLLSRRYSGTGELVLLLIDVDHMELINDRYGFAAGDRVLASLARMLKEKLRNAEIFARLGGDDFAVVIEGLDDRELAEIATQIVKEFENMAHVTNGQEFRATISAGAASLDLDNNIKAWLNNAKLALKSAKSGGRNRVMKAKAKQL